MLFALEKENKLKTFTVNLKNISYMGVRLSEISETDEFYLNYCSTFKRTFDTVELKINRNHTLPIYNVSATSSSAIDKV